MKKLLILLLILICTSCNKKYTIAIIFKDNTKDTIISYSQNIKLQNNVLTNTIGGNDYNIATEVKYFKILKKEDE